MKRKSGCNSSNSRSSRSSSSRHRRSMHRLGSSRTSPDQSLRPTNMWGHTLTDSPEERSGSDEPEEEEEMWNLQPSTTFADSSTKPNDNSSKLRPPTTR